MVVAISIFNVKVAPCASHRSGEYARCSIFTIILVLFCFDRACVVVAISMSNVRVAHGFPTALLNKQGASFS